MLRIEVHALALDNPPKGKLLVEVQGSRSGPLASEPVPAAHPNWNPYFRIDCNHTDKLLLRIMNVKQQSAREVGCCEFYCSRFVKEHRKKLSWEDPMEYNLDILEGEEVRGVLSTYVCSDPTISFQGQFPQSIDLSLSSHGSSFPLYLGKCPTVNAFSFLDEPAIGQYCKFSESIYRDHQ